MYPSIPRKLANFAEPHATSSFLMAHLDLEIPSGTLKSTDSIDGHKIY